MRITIIRDDGVVGVDGLFRQVDLSAFAAGNSCDTVEWRERAYRVRQCGKRPSGGHYSLPVDS